MATEYLTFVASVVDSFSDTLERLSDDLRAVGVQAETLDRQLSFDVDVDDTELDALQAELASTVGLAEGIDSAVGDVDMGDLRGPDPSAVAQAAVGGGNGTSATTDGGRTDTPDVSSLRPDTPGREQVIAEGIPIENVRDRIQLRTLRREPKGINIDEPSAFERLIEAVPVGGNDDRNFFEAAGDLAPTASQLNNLRAALVPLLAVFVGALPAVIAGVVALGAAALGAAAALAAITGLGALGVALQGGQLNRERLQQKLRATLDTILAALAPLAERLAPLFDVVLQGVEDLADGLAERGNVLLAFRDDFRAFVDTIVGGLPRALALITRLGDVASPVFAALATAFSAEQVFGGLATFLADVLPILADLSALFVQMLVGSVQLSKGFLIVAEIVLIMVNSIGLLVKRLFGLLQIVTALMPGINDMTTALGILLATGLALIVAFKALSLVYAVLTSEILVSFVLAIYEAITGMITMTGAAGTLAAALGTLVVLVTILTGGLVLIGALAGFVSSQFNTMTSDIKDATRALDRFGRTRDAIGAPGTAIEGVGGNANVYVDDSSTTIQAESVEQGKRLSRTHQYHREQKIDTSVTR